MYLYILLPSILALYALYTKKATIPAIIFAWILGFVVCYFGDFYAFGALALTYILVVIGDKIKKSKKDKMRNIYQIISTTLTAVLCIILYYLTDVTAFYTMYYAVLASSLGDTLSSSLGGLSKNKPVNIFTMEKLEKGASGGVTLLGTFVSLLGGIIIGLVYLLKVYDLEGFIIISVLALLGSLFDSIMGILLQAQYRCVACKEVVEEAKHCKQKTKLIRGYAFIDNNIVNLLSNILVFVLCYFLLR